MGKVEDATIIKQPSILGLKIFQLEQIIDNRGAVLHMLRADSKHFKEFGEIYFSEVNVGYEKKWKKHLKMTQNFTVPVGKILFKFYDDRPASKSYGMKEKIIIGRPNQYYLVIVPPLIWYSFKNVFDKQSLIANCSSIPHDPAETINDNPKILDF